MPLLPRPGSRAPGPDAAERVLALLGTDHGWVPAAPLAEAVASGSSQEPAWVPDPPADASAAAPDPPATPAASPDAPPTVRALLRSGRVDPGRQGVAALALVGVLAAAVAAYFVLRGRPSERPLTPPPVAGTVLSTSGPELVVDVAGRVRHPGLVHLPAGARVDDALTAAGGVQRGVSTGALNLARKVADGEQVLVGVDAPAASGSAGGLLDLNTATASELDALPGIGPVLADKIVTWRTDHGRFASVDQLRQVGGIGEAKYASLKAKVRV